MSTFTPGLSKWSRSVLRLTLLCLTAFVFTAATAQNCFINSRIHKITANVSPTIKSYMEFMPVDYATNPTKKYALLVYLGGTGEMFQQPGGSDQDLCPILGYSLPWRMNVGHFPNEVTDQNGQKFSYLVVMPFVTKWEEQYQVDPGAMIDYALQAYPNRIDVNRIYLTGMSRGTDNIMGYVTSSTTAANRIAAIVPAANCFPANVGSTLFTQQVSNLAAGNVRLWGISCQGDRPCPEQYIKNWVDSLNKLKPGNGRFTYAVMACDTAGPNASFHYAWNQAYDPDYRPAPDNKNVYEWMIQFSKNGAPPPPPPPPPPTGTPNCSTIVITPGTTNIVLSGLSAPVVTIQIFNNSWATVYNQVHNNPGTVTVPSLTAGTYHVKVNFYTSGWTNICEKMADAVVGTSNPPPPPPPPPPTGTPDCSKITVTGGVKLIKIKGLVAPVATVQIFNGSWATTFNQSYTNSPDSITVSNLAAGTYHVKVSFLTSAWSNICEKIQDATVTATTEPAPIDTRTAAIAPAEEITATAKHVAIAPNPFANTLMVTIGSNKNENASIIVMDLAGRVLLNKSVTLQKGINRFSLDGGKYRPGNYILRLATSERVENVRVIKQ